MAKAVIVEYTVRICARSEQDTEALIYKALHRHPGAVWFRSGREVRVLGGDDD